MKSLYKLALAASVLLIGTAVYAQELNVKSFRLDPKDKTACRKATAKKDANGKKCAVIKLIDGKETLYQSEGATAVATQPALMYVSAKDKSVKIDNAELGSVEYEFPIALKAGKTYILELEAIPAPEPEPEPEPEPVVVADQQFVLFTVNPAQAVIELGSETLTARDGEAQKLLEVGDYKFKISAKGFYPQEGEFTLTADEKYELEVSLREANGWLKVLDNDEAITDASVYIDDEFVGKAPLKVGQLLNGEHKLLIAQEQYNNYIATINIKDNDTLVVSPCLDPRFSIVTITTKEGSEIWANGEKKGEGTWTGKLLAGVYDFEAREIGYTSAVVTEKIEINPEVVEIVIPDPTPIYGNIVIMSYPAKACVFVDGEHVGKSPVYLPKVKYGKHCIEIYKKGFKPDSLEVDMDESKRIVVEAELEALPEECEEAAECEEACCQKAEEEAPAECCEEKPAEEQPAECCEEKPAECCEEKCEEPCEAPAETLAEEPAEAPAEEPAEQPAEPEPQPEPEQPAEPEPQPEEPAEPAEPVEPTEPAES